MHTQPLDLKFENYTKKKYIQEGESRLGLF